MGLTQWSSETDAPNRSQFETSFNNIDTYGAMFLQDVIANRPAAGTVGRFFFATDTSALWYDNGTTWVPSNPQAAQSAAGYPGLAGAAQTFRIVGATNGGPPSSGTWQAGDIAFDAKFGIIWVCTGAGAPGQWGTGAMNASQIVTTNSVGGLSIQYPYPIYGPAGATPYVVMSSESPNSPNQRGITINPINNTYTNGGVQAIAYWTGNAGVNASEIVPVQSGTLRINYTVGIRTF